MDSIQGHRDHNYGNVNCFSNNISICILYFNCIFSPFFFTELHNLYVLIKTHTS
jgi:hypothetical protein